MKILLDISGIVNLYGGRSNGPYGAKAGGWVIPHLWRTNCPISECHISLPLLSKGHRWCIWIKEKWSLGIDGRDLWNSEWAEINTHFEFLAHPYHWTEVREPLILQHLKFNALKYNFHSKWGRTYLISILLRNSFWNFVEYY